MDVKQSIVLTLTITPDLKIVSEQTNPLQISKVSEILTAFNSPASTVVQPESSFIPAVVPAVTVATVPVADPKMSFNIALFAQSILEQMRGEFDGYKKGKTDEQKKIIDQVMSDYVMISTKIAIETDIEKIKKLQHELEIIQVNLNCLDSENDIVFFTKSCTIIGKAIVIIAKAALSAAV